MVPCFCFRKRNIAGKRNLLMSLFYQTCKAEYQYDAVKPTDTSQCFKNFLTRFIIASHVLHDGVIFLALQSSDKPYHPKPLLTLEIDERVRSL